MALAGTHKKGQKKGFVAVLFIDFKIFCFHQRVAMFSSYAMSAMCEAGFDVIDIYPMTDSYPGGTLDVVHYPDHLFSSMVRMLEKYKVNNYRQLSGNERVNRIKRCIGWLIMKWITRTTTRAWTGIQRKHQKNRRTMERLNYGNKESLILISTILQKKRGTVNSLFWGSP